MSALLLVGRADAQISQSPSLEDLPKLATTWPPSWAALVREIVPPGKDFEKDTLAKLDALLLNEPPTSQTNPLADAVLAATLRHHESIRRVAPLVDNPWQPLGSDLRQRLAHLRKDWLEQLRKSGDLSEALRLADRWLPATSRDDPTQLAILGLWTDQANAAMDKDDYVSARAWLNRIEHGFDSASAANEAAKRLRDRAASLFKESQSLSDAQAIPLLQQALVLWPRLPEARDAIERRRGTYATLVIAVPALPENLSPATATTVVERQMLDLMFDRLYCEEVHSLGRRYRPQAAAALPGGASIPLRRDIFWSDGQRLTAAEVRHTALLLNDSEAFSRSGLWRDFVDVPRADGAFALQIGYRLGLLDPLLPLTFHVLPQYYRGKQLSRADDPEFARAPLASGPFQYVGRKGESGRLFALFQASPHDLRGGARSLREIRLTMLGDPAKGLPKPLPQLILDAPTGQVPALLSQGYKELRMPENSQVAFLAINHRKAAFASAPLRRAIAHALDRQTLLDRHFRAPSLKDKYHTTLNGLMPRGSWAMCPAPRVPEELFHVEQARLFAKLAKKEVNAVDCTLQYPSGDARVQAACEEMAGAVREVLREAGIQANIQARASQPGDLRKAIHERNFDLVYTRETHLDDPVRLALLFDPHADATRAGGRNYLGYDSDVKLQELLGAAVKHRQFSVVQTNMHAVHAHLYETMPLIPLWQLDVHVLAQPSLQMPPLDSSNVFARIHEWALAR
jgi:hypothetical protein